MSQISTQVLALSQESWIKCLWGVNHYLRSFNLYLSLVLHAGKQECSVGCESGTLKIVSNFLCFFYGVLGFSSV